jgi:hypothetical protein
VLARGIRVHGHVGLSAAEQKSLVRLLKKWLAYLEPNVAGDSA